MHPCALGVVKVGGVKVGGVKVGGVKVGGVKVGGVKVGGNLRPATTDANARNKYSLLKDPDPFARQHFSQSVPAPSTPLTPSTLLPARIVGSVQVQTSALVAADARGLAFASTPPGSSSRSSSDNKSSSASLPTPARMMPTPALLPASALVAPTRYNPHDPQQERRVLSVTAYVSHRPHLPPRHRCRLTARPPPPVQAVRVGERPIAWAAAAADPLRVGARALNRRGGAKVGTEHLRRFVGGKRAARLSVLVRTTV